MKSLWVALAASGVLGGAVLASSACAAAEAVRIVCLGDSVTRGVRQGVTPEQTFCAVLEKDLSREDRPVEVINAGIGGNTTADALRRFDADVLAKNPQYVVIMFGLNDSWIDDGKTASRLTVAQYRDNLGTMLDALAARKIGVVLLTPNPAIAPFYPPERNRTLRGYVEAVRALAHERQLPLIDLYARFAELALEGRDNNELFTDAMHPNPTGQKLIADLLAAHFRRELDR